MSTLRRAGSVPISLRRSSFLCISILNIDVLPLDVIQFAETFAESFDAATMTRSRTGNEKSYSWNSSAARVGSDGNSK
jgi:hypothetical protein